MPLNYTINKQKNKKPSRAHACLAIVNTTKEKTRAVEGGEKASTHMKLKENHRVDPPSSKPEPPRNAAIIDGERAGTTVHVPDEINVYKMVQS